MPDHMLHDGVDGYGEGYHVPGRECISQASIHACQIQIQNHEKEVTELKDRLGKLEEKYNVIYKMATSIEVLTTQMIHINDTMREMKQEFSQDIKDIKQEQINLGDKVDKIEVNSDAVVSERNQRKKIKTSMISSVLEKLILIILSIILLALFPQLKDLIT